MKIARDSKSAAGRIVLWLLPAAAATALLAFIFTFRPGMAHAHAQGQDTDGDGMPDAWEATFGLDPDDPSDAALDADADGLSNLQEYLAGTYPVSDDSDGDGLLDPWEIEHGLNPLSGLRPDLAGWWRFAEASGTTVTDWSGQGRDAEILAPGHVSRVTGAPVGGALRFDGVSDAAFLGLGGYVRVAALTNAPLSGGFTAAAWVRAASFTDAAAILTRCSDHDALSDGFALYLDGATPAGYVRHGGVAANRVTAPPAVAGQWVHLCLVYDGDCTALYANGVLAALATNTAGDADCSDALWIGTAYGGGDGYPLHGDIADVRLYTAALPAQDIADLLETYADPDGDGLCNLDEQTAGTDPPKPRQRQRRAPRRLGGRPRTRSAQRLGCIARPRRRRPDESPGVPARLESFQLRHRRRWHARRLGGRLRPRPGRRERHRRHRRRRRRRPRRVPPGTRSPHRRRLRRRRPAQPAHPHADGVSNVQQPTSNAQLSSEQPSEHSTTNSRRPTFKYATFDK